MSVHVIESDAGYSPPLHIELELHGQRFDVSEMGPEFVRLRGAASAAPGTAIVRVDLDGRATVVHVDLFDGIDPRRKRQPCRQRTPAADQSGRPLAAAG